MRPTEEQENAVAAATHNLNLMITAFAGCAKTSTLQLMAPQIRTPALALAFNKRVQLEISSRLPSNFVCKTLNALGLQVWAKSVGHIEVDQRKTGRLVTEVAKECKSKLRSEQWQWTRDLVDKALQSVFRPEEMDWFELAIDVGIPSDEIPFLTELAAAVLKRDIELAMKGIISFADQLYCPTLLGGMWPKFPVVMIDESQDLSPLNHLMLRQIIRPGGRLIAVGDPLQAIYGWRGADYQSMLSMRALAEDWTDLPLTMTFRCPKVIVQRQQSHAAGFRAFEGNRSGQVEALAPNWSCQILQRGKGSCAVLCRNNSPLIILALKLLRRRIPCRVLGRDIGSGLLALSKKLAPEEGTSASSIQGTIKEWMSAECELARLNNRSDESIIDRAECLLAVIEGSECRDAGQLRRILTDLFSQDNEFVTLSSIHRAKGLEWDTVLHLDPWRVPSKRAKSLEAKRQESNLLYVAETRTRDVLLNANLKDFSEEDI